MNEDKKYVIGRKRKDALYKSIDDNIMDFRIKVKQWCDKNGVKSIPYNTLDDMLFRLNVTTPQKALEALRKTEKE